MRTSLEQMHLERLWELRRDGDPAAREELARRFGPLARKLALRYLSAAEPLEDLVQVANIGLLEAIDRFDPERGNGFSAFAVPTILGELKRHFRNTAWAVHVPRGLQELALEVSTATQKLTGDLGRSPSAGELARYMEREIEDVLTGLDAGRARHATSLETPVSADDAEPVPLADMVGADDDGYDLIDAAAVLLEGVRRLPYMERRALGMRFNEELTQSEIARRMGCSQMQVSRLIKRGTDRLRGRLDPAA